MARIQLTLPPPPYFTTTIPIRITDLNYGAHVGNDAILSLIHEARIQYLRHFGYDELQFAGVSLIMSDVAIEFKAQLFYGSQLEVAVAADGFSRVGFELYYRLFVKTESTETTIAHAKTGMVCFDYAAKKVALLPEEARQKMRAF